MKSVLFTTHHPKLLFIWGKWQFVKLVCHILRPYLPFLSKIKADFEFSSGNASEGFLIRPVLPGAQPSREGAFFLAKVQPAAEDVQCSSLLFPCYNFSLIRKTFITETLCFSVNCVFCSSFPLYLFSASNQILSTQMFVTAPYTGVHILERQHLDTVAFAETTHIGFCACGSLPSQGRWGR